MNNSADLIHSDRSFRTIIIMLSWPIFIEQLLTSLIKAADAAMVGSLGAAATASVSINYAPNMLIEGVIFAMGVGFTALIARSIGAKDYARARHLTQQAITICTIVCIPITVAIFALARAIPSWMGGEPEILDDAEIYNRILAYSFLFRSYTMILTAIFRGYGDTATPMRVNVLVNVLNLIGNFLLIYETRDVNIFGHTFTIWGAGMGVAGAAWSTSVSGMLGGLGLVLMCFIKNSDMKVKLDRGFIPDAHELKLMFDISFPAMLERFTMSSAFIVVTHAIATLGTAAVAASNLSGTAESISFMPGFAFGAAVTTLFGQSLGAGREDRALTFVRETIKIGTVIMIFASIVMYLGSSRIMHIFTPDTEVIEMGSLLLKILAVIQVPQMIAAVYSGALKGAGDSRSPFYITLISMWGIRLIGTVFCIHILHMGIASACICMCLDNCVRCLLFHMRYRQRRWEVGEGVSDR